VARRLVAIALFIVAILALIATAVDASDEPIYISCAQKGAEPKPKSHPHDCMTVGSGVFKHSAGLLVLDLQKIAWSRWGSGTAKAVASAVDPETHARAKIRFSVTGRQVCEELTYYARIVLEYPKRLYPRHLGFELSCGSAPAGAGAAT
jgi:hypothetical protein